MCFILVCARLEAYERNDNFNNIPDTGVGPAFHMDLPTFASYKDINTDMQVVLCVSHFIGCYTV